MTRGRVADDATMRRDPARCDGVTRRDVLRLGSLTALGLSVSSWATLRAASTRPAVPKATSCILIWLDGGPSHLETFDPKPEAPRRGPRARSRPIATTCRACAIGEPLPNLAASARPRGDRSLDDLPARRAQPRQSLPADRLPAHAGTRLSELRRGHGAPARAARACCPPTSRVPGYDPAAGAGLPRRRRAGRSPSGATPRSPGSGSAISTPSRASTGLRTATGVASTSKPLDRFEPLGRVGAGR